MQRMAFVGHEHPFEDSRRYPEYGSSHDGGTGRPAVSDLAYGFFEEVDPTKKSTIDSFSKNCEGLGRALGWRVPEP